jgi:hypothetical protein
MSETSNEGLGPSRCSSIKRVSDLSEDERFSIAFGAGVPIKEMVQTDDGIKMVLCPSDITIHGNKYVVVWRP